MIECGFIVEATRRDRLCTMVRGQKLSFIVWYCEVHSLLIVNGETVISEV